MYSYFTYIIIVNSIDVSTALTLDPVQNLKATVDTHEPSVTLKWDPPANAACAIFII